MAIFDLSAPKADGATAFSSVCEEGISPPEVHAALNHILASAGFFRSHRMSRLLQFLVKKALADEIREAREYAIGIEVFDRNPSTYNTCDDPIVRVQVGRLREKLHDYYQGTGAQAEILISIPMGKYMPIIRRRRPKPLLPLQLGVPPVVAVMPLSYIALDNAGLSFTSGLSEELAHYLFHQFSYQIVPPSIFGSLAGGRAADVKGMVTDAGKVGMYWLEGSIRSEADRMRASFRLIDSEAGRITWAAHFDRPPQFSISAQEELAASIGGDLHRYFCRSGCGIHPPGA